MRRISASRPGGLYSVSHPRKLALLASLLILLISSFFFATNVTHAASYCQVTYTVNNQWPGGFGGSITIQNTSSSAWTSWTLAFAFWALTMSSFIGILKALGSGAPGGIQGGADAGGAGFMLMDVVGGLVGLGLLIAWGMARSASRDKRLDASTEASTAALYDHIERRGGDDMIDRSPEARRPHERDSYRPA